MSTRTKYLVQSTPTASVFLRLTEGPIELRVHLSPKQARDLASKLLTSCMAVELGQREPKRAH